MRDINSIEVGAIGKFPAANLSFDHKNPRLATGSEDDSTSSEKEIIRKLKNLADLKELLNSIAANGYLDMEPMIIVKENDIIRVLEGNRRLAAIRLFKNPALAEELNITLPSITNEYLNSLNEVLVYRVATAKEARPFIGFKHINGAHKWDAIAKANYATDWYLEGNIPVSEIAERLGDSFDTVRKMIAGMLALKQAEKKGLFRVDERYPSKKFPFSHLYTALTRLEYREYLGLEGPGTGEPQDNPVPDDKLDRLQNVLIWLYGDKKDDKRPIIKSQNPDLKYLGKVLKSDKAIAILESKQDLSYAYESLTPASTAFKNALYEAQTNAELALSKISSYEGGDEELLETAEALSQTMSVICDVMRSKKFGSN